MWPVYMISTVTKIWKKSLYQTVNLPAWFHKSIVQNNFCVIKLETFSQTKQFKYDIIQKLINFKKIAKHDFFSNLIKHGGHSEK